MNIILFNGPPGCGKDTAAHAVYLDREYADGDTWWDRFSAPHKHAFAAITDTELDEFLNNLCYEPIKEGALEFLFGKSYRNWQQDFSEKFMKPLYGDDIFAKLFVIRAEAYARDPDTILIPDAGFSIEATTVRALMPRARILLLRIHRPGCDFSNDTREYITVPGANTVLDIQNDRSKEEFEAAVLHVTREWLT